MHDASCWPCNSLPLSLDPGVLLLQIYGHMYHACLGLLYIYHMYGVAQL